MIFILTAIAVLTAAATLHWRLFAVPLLKKMLDPLAFNQTVTSRVVKAKFPQDFKQAHEDAKREHELWSGA